MRALVITRLGSSEANVGGSADGGVIFEIPK